MNTKRIVAIKDDDCLCYKCIQKKNKEKIHIIHIGSMGYGSDFDNFGTKLQLCDECYVESIKDKPIWDMEVVYGQMHFDNYISKEDVPESQIVSEFIDNRYRYDDEMSNYLSELPIESKELVFNRNGYGACANDIMSAQDYIDYQLGELPHIKCKQYGLHSSQEIAAYKERFSNCGCVKIDKYYDGSQGSSCPYGARGDKDGNIGSNIWNECYMCTHYIPRRGDIEIVDKIEEYYKNEKDRLIHMIQYAGSRLRELEDSVQKYISHHK